MTRPDAPYLEDLKRMAEAVEISSPRHYRIEGQTREFPGATTPAEAPPLLPQLEADLYLRFYTRPTAGATYTDPMAQRDNLNRLSEANRSLGTWEAGWIIGETDEDGRVAVTKDGVTFWAPPANLRTRSGQVCPGDPCRVWVGKELRHLIPGFYLAFGNGDERDTRDTAETRVRFYWHLTEAAAAPYLDLATQALNEHRIPFRTKVLSDPGAYFRADAGVLYVERRHVKSVLPIVRRMHEKLGALLRPEVPLFTQCLLPGLGVAEDPGNGLSFGQARCRLVAAGLWSAFCRGLNDEVSRLEAILEAFREQGIDPSRPYLAKGSFATYDLDERIQDLNLSGPLGAVATWMPAIPRSAR